MRTISVSMAAVGMVFSTASYAQTVTPFFGSAAAITANLSDEAGSMSLGPIAAGSESSTTMFAESRLEQTSQSALTLPGDPLSELNEQSSGLTSGVSMTASTSTTSSVEAAVVNSTANIQTSNLKLARTTFSQVGLTVAASGLSVSGTASHGVVPFGHSKGSATISGALLDGELVSTIADAPPNTVLYKSPTITIIQNEQDSIQGTCSTGPCISNGVLPTLSSNGIRVTALVILLTGAKHGSLSITGEIDYAQAVAISPVVVQ